jgi:hypothetical protein
MKGIAAPGTVIDARAHRLAEFAVARNIDAEVALAADDVGDRRA